MGGKRKGSKQAAAEVVPDEFRCKRSDGKSWRCSARSAEGKGMCEKHIVQAKKRQAIAALKQPSTKRLKGEEKANSNLLKKAAKGELPRKDKKLVSCDNESESHDDTEQDSDPPSHSLPPKHIKDVKALPQPMKNPKHASRVSKKAAKGELPRKDEVFSSDKESASDKGNESDSDSPPDGSPSRPSKNVKPSSLPEKHPNDASKVVKMVAKGEIPRRVKQTLPSDEESESDDNKLEPDSPFVSKSLKPSFRSAKHPKDASKVRKKAAKGGRPRKHKKTVSSESESEFDDDNHLEALSPSDSPTSEHNKDVKCFAVPREHSKDDSKMLKKVTTRELPLKDRKAVSSGNESEPYDDTEADCNSPSINPPSNHSKGVKPLPRPKNHLKDSSKVLNKAAKGGGSRRNKKAVSGDNDSESHDSDSLRNNPLSKHSKETKSLPLLPTKHPKVASTGQGNHSRYKKINKRAGKLKKAVAIGQVERLERDCDGEDGFEENEIDYANGFERKMREKADIREEEEKDTYEFVSKLKKDADVFERPSESVDILEREIRANSHSQHQKKLKEKVDNFETKSSENTDSSERKIMANTDDHYKKNVKEKVDDFERKVRFKDEPDGKGSKRKMKVNGKQHFERNTKRKLQDQHRAIKETKKARNDIVKKYETEKKLRDNSKDLVKEKEDDGRMKSRPKTDDSGRRIKDTYGDSTRNVKDATFDNSNSMERVRPSKSQKISALCYMLSFLLPLLKSLDKKQSEEIEFEAKLQGISGVNIERTRMKPDERLYCDYCNTSVVDLYRSCPDCNYDLCLACCQELREGKLLGSKQASVDIITEVQNDKLAIWKANEDGSIPCPLGCGHHKIVLRQTGKHGWITNLVRDVEAAIDNKIFIQSESSGPYQSCSAENVSPFDHSKCLHQAAQRSNSSDNFIYYPSALDMGKDAFEHFQKHWLHGEPVIVRDVLEINKELNWDPSVMWRERTKHKLPEDTEIVKVIDHLDCSEVEIDIHQFFKGYQDGRIRENGWPQMLELKDCPPANFFHERLPLHGTEIISALPFHDYTHPTRGMLNLATKIPNNLAKTSLGPKTYMAYGVEEELGCGDSVTKLHCNLSDTVNVLTHCTDVRLSDWQCAKIRETNQRSASGCPDQIIEPVINTIGCPDKEQKLNEAIISEAIVGSLESEDCKVTQAVDDNVGVAEIPKAALTNHECDSGIYAQDESVKSLSVRNVINENIDNGSIMMVEDAPASGIMVLGNDDSLMFRDRIPDGTIGAKITMKPDNKILNIVTVDGHVSRLQFDHVANEQSVHPEINDNPGYNGVEDPRAGVSILEEPANGDSPVTTVGREITNSIQNIASQRDCDAKVVDEDALVKQKGEHVEIEREENGEDHVLIEQKGESYHYLSKSEIDCHLVKPQIVECDHHNECKETQTVRKECHYEEAISCITLAEKTDVIDSVSQVMQIDIQHNLLLCEAERNITDTKKETNHFVSEMNIVPEANKSVQAKIEHEDMSDHVKPREDEDSHYSECQEAKAMSKEYQYEEVSNCLILTEKADVIDSDSQVIQIDVQETQLSYEGKSSNTEMNEENAHNVSEKDILPEPHGLEEHIQVKAEYDHMDDHFVKPQGVEVSNNGECQETESASKECQNKEADITESDSQIIQTDIQNTHKLNEENSNVMEIQEENDHFVLEKSIDPEPNTLEEPVPVKADQENMGDQLVNLGVECQKTQAMSTDCQYKEAPSHVIHDKKADILDLVSQMSQIDMQNPHLLCDRTEIKEENDNSVAEKEIVSEANVVEESAPAKVEHELTYVHHTKPQVVEDSHHHQNECHDTHAMSKEQEASNQVIWAEKADIVDENSNPLLGKNIVPETDTIESIPVKVEGDRAIFEEKDHCMKTVAEDSHHAGINLQKDLCADNKLESANGAALWDIFRREDVPKLQAYLKQHWREFKHSEEKSLIHVDDPIHDQTIFLNEEHKRKLKEEYGIEAWTFQQHLGEAVFIPAGCPHQVRNMKSCFKVALDFVTPENVLECIRLTEEFRLLPKGHHAKENMLEVMKIVIFAAAAAVKQVNHLLKS